MTKKMLLSRLWLVGLLLAATIVVGVLIRVQWGEDVFEVFKDLLPVVISIVAVYLAHIFQQRSVFVQSLRKLWSDIIDAKNELLSYVNCPELKQENYSKAYRSISAVIDEMRGVYRNVGEDEEYVGYFPYEPLHDMRKALERLGHDDATEENRAHAGDAIEQAWLAMRYDFLYEFETPEPTYPILSRDTRRTQKHGSSAQ